MSKEKQRHEQKQPSITKICFWLGWLGWLGWMGWLNELNSTCQWIFFQSVLYICVIITFSDIVRHFIEVCCKFFYENFQQDSLGYTLAITAACLSALGTVLTKKLTGRFDKIAIRFGLLQSKDQSRLVYLFQTHKQGLHELFSTTVSWYLCAQRKYVSVSLNLWSSGSNGRGKVEGPWQAAW